MKQIFLLMLSASLVFTSCTKNDDPQPEESNTVQIGATSYSTVKIGTQTWTSVNYNGSGGVNYDNSSTNNSKLGKLYTIDEAKAIVLLSGWRLPTKGDYEKLLTSLGGTAVANPDVWVGAVEGNATVTKKLMSNESWIVSQGNNSSGFNAYPAGLFYNKFFNKGKAASFWTSTYLPAPHTVVVNTFYVDNYIDNSTTYTESGIGALNIDGLLSLRFVKDN